MLVTSEQSEVLFKRCSRHNHDFFVVMEKLRYMDVLDILFLNLNKKGWMKEEEFYLHLVGKVQGHDPYYFLKIESEILHLVQQFQSELTDNIDLEGFEIESTRNQVKKKVKEYTLSLFGSENDMFLRKKEDYYAINHLFFLHSLIESYYSKSDKRKKILLHRALNIYQSMVYQELTGDSYSEDWRYHTYLSKKMMSDIFVHSLPVLLGFLK